MGVGLVEALEDNVFVLGLDHEEHADFGCALADHADVNVVVSESPAGCGRNPDIFRMASPTMAKMQRSSSMDGVWVEHVLDGDRITAKCSGDWIAEQVTREMFNVRCLKSTTSKLARRLPREEADRRAA